MHALIVLACSMAAAVVRGAPLPGASALVEEPKFQELLQRVHSLTQKMLLSIPDTHRSCVQTETLKLNSSENAKLVTMASIIGIPPAPVLKAVSENFTLENSLERMSEGLHLHRSLLLRVSPRLEAADKVASLMADIRDLAIQIVKMQKMLRPEAEVQQAPDPLDLRLPGNYEVQVAVHMTLVQLQSFGRDMMRCLGSLDQGSEEEAEI
ncbi:colony stimulating factor 3 (granulocyte) a [Menidia menidia]